MKKGILRYTTTPPMGGITTVVGIEVGRVKVSLGDTTMTNMIEINLPSTAEVGHDGLWLFVKYESVINDQSYDEQNFYGALERRHTRVVRFRPRMSDSEFRSALSALRAITEEAEAEHAVSAAIALSRNY